MKKRGDYYLPGDYNRFETILGEHFRSATNSDFVGVYVHDGVCGSGKTTSIFEHINGNILVKDKDARIMFVCPYLKECHRVAETISVGDKGSSPKRDKRGDVIRTSRKFFDRVFHHPEKKPSKFNHLKILLAQGKDVVITHKLFSRLDNECINLLRRYRYHLILDEEPSTFELASDKYAERLTHPTKPGYRKVVKMSQSDIDTFFSQGMLKEKPDGTVSWGEGTLKRYNDIMEDAHNDKLRLSYHPDNKTKSRVLMWRQNPAVYRSFKSVNLLTYLFKGGLTQAYFDTEKIPYFIAEDTLENMLRKNGAPAFHNLIKVNKMSETDFTPLEQRLAFSSSWYNQAIDENAPALKEMKCALTNYFKQHLADDPVKVTDTEKLWSTYKKAEYYLKGRGYTKRHVAFNKLATNEYIHVRKMAYMVAVTPPPMITSYIKKRGGLLQDNAYRRYNIIQWIFRSAIREGKPIHVAIVSNVMRKELMSWMKEYSFLHAFYNEVMDDVNGIAISKSRVSHSVKHRMRYSELLNKQPGVKHLSDFNGYLRLVKLILFTETPAKVKRYNRVVKQTI